MSDGDEIIDAYITKYALSSGIIRMAARLVPDSSTQMIELIGCMYSQYCHGEGREWHRTKESAINRAEELRAKKIASLKKQIKKLEQMKF